MCSSPLRTPGTGPGPPQSVSDLHTEQTRPHKAAVMKVLKKIKARIGLSHKTGGHCPPAQPLEFHPVHGDNILLSANNTIAARYSHSLTVSNLR